MEREQLEIEIMKDGRVRVMVKGRKGHRCMDVKEAFKEFLGPVRSSALTDEYYEEENHAYEIQFAKARSR
jgi:hypothetical protein